ncbi:hypothetical protein PR202_gb27907 [Eleusine coracana subsp. coracana]|uniref:Uncharacterized protein n=1 Tax=Eleusine coracana subsp. coracana TaxID=191504 RepID=A0AAV5FWI1_ELECO|nr:hypothetical protein PR202_gb27907 [Eleusine coracana subsp. coracana]
MADEPLDASPTATSAVASAGGPAAAPALRPRREAFEYGLLPIPKLVFPEGTLTQTLSQLKERLAPGGPRVGAAPLAEALQIPAEQAALVLGTLAAVLPAEDPALGCDGAGEADLRDLLLFLYIQSYKRLVPRANKDSPAVADVWPSTSAFDGYLSVLSPIQLVRSNSRRFMPSQADEEAHQLSYLQKHMANILSLLSDSVDGESDESMVLTMETFEHLGFLLQFPEGTPLSQAASFFANSDPDMPAAPVPVAVVHEWILQHIASSLECTAKENNQQSVSDPDVTMTDAVTNIRIQSSAPPGTSLLNNPGYYRSTTFVEGFSKTSVVQTGIQYKGELNKAPLKYATVYGCSDTTVVLGAIGKVAPFNTYYPQLGEHLAQVGVDPSVNKWDQPFVLGVIDPHDSLSHPAGVSDVQAESASCMDPDLFTNFLHASLEDIQKNIRELELDDNRKKELACALHAQFKDWLYASGNIRQLYCLQGE